VPALVVDRERERGLARNDRRAVYFRSAASSLAADLAARGARLIVRRDATPKSIVRLAREAGAATVCWSAAYDAEQLERDRTLQAELEEAGFRVSVVHDAPAIAPDETAAAKSDDDGEGYRALTSYVRIWRTLPRESPERYPAIDLAAYAEGGAHAGVVDRVLLSSEPFHFKAHHLAEVRALVPGAEVALIDGEMTSWYGSRAIQGMRYLTSLARDGAPTGL